MGRNGDLAMGRQQTADNATSIVKTFREIREIREIRILLTTDNPFPQLTTLSSTVANPQNQFLSMKSLLAKISSNTETIGVIGLGYVGLPLAVNFAQAGVRVIGFDKSQTKVDKINHGENYIKDIRDAVLREVVGNIKLTATTDFTRIKECDALLICVPTPLDKFRKPDMSYIESACIAIGQNMKPATFISLESTTYPTTTEEFMLPLIEESSKQNPLVPERRPEQRSVSKGSEAVEGTLQPYNLPPRNRLLAGLFARTRRSGKRKLPHKKYTQSFRSNYS
jgi:hypothetical protein